jgi:hypothetical protein
MADGSWEKNMGCGWKIKEAMEKYSTNIGKYKSRCSHLIRYQFPIHH